MKSETANNVLAQWRNQPKNWGGQKILGGAKIF